MQNILAFDLGGSSLKLAIVAEDGRFLGQVRKRLKIERQGEARFETDPMIWWRAFREGCAELAGMGHDFATIGAVAGCGITRTQVFLDVSGTPIRPAITFQDYRSAGTLRKMQVEDCAGASAILRALGPFDPLARLLWVQRNEPDSWKQLGRIVEPKDFLNTMLTGIAVSDTISQTPMNKLREAHGADALSALGIDADILPDTHSPFDRIGEVRSGLDFPLSRLTGARVHCGSLDTWACVLGSGALVPGVAYSISGTSDVFGVISETCQTAEGLLSVEWGPGLWQLGGPSQGAATCLHWATDRFFPGSTLAEALEEAFLCGRQAPLFLPYLDGERTPWWDADLRGAFLGLSATHGNADFLRGVAEGITYLSREILARAEGALGLRVDHVSFSGGLAFNRLLCQLKADVLQRPVQVPKNRETGLVGAAKIAQTKDREESVKPEDFLHYEPNLERRNYHEDRFSVFESASAAVRPISHRMSGLV